MTRPDVFGLAREVMTAEPLADRTRHIARLHAEGESLRFAAERYATEAARLATALLALEPLIDALDVWRTTEPNYAQIRAVRHLIAMHDTARAALGRETT